MTGFIITLLIIIYRIPLINLLGDKGMGYYSTALVIYLFVMTCIAYGLPNAVSSLIHIYNKKRQYDLVYKTIQCSFLYALIAGGAGTIIFFFGADFLSTHLMNATYSASAIQAFAPGLLFVTLLGALNGIYSGLRIPSVLNASHLIEHISIITFSLILTYVFTRSEATTGEFYCAAGAVLGISAGIFIAFVFAFTKYSKYHKKLRKLAVKTSDTKGAKKSDIIRNIIITMVPFILTFTLFHLSCLLDYAVFNRIMSVQGHKENSYIILLGMLNGKYEFFISIPILIVYHFISSKVPFMIRIINEGNKRKIHTKISQCVRYCMLFIIPWTVIYLLYANPLMNLFFHGSNDIPALILRSGAVSIIFYSLALISNSALTALEDWASVAKNAMISVVIQLSILLIMLVIFQWGIMALIISRIVFSAFLFILNEHTLRERTGYVQEHKRTFHIPLTSSVIMGIVSLPLYLVLDLFLKDIIAVIIVILIAVPVYIMSLVFLGGITQREMYQIPGGKFLAPLCRKLHFNK